jgi:hypothetical protein
LKIMLAVYGVQEINQGEARVLDAKYGIAVFE